MEEPKRENRWSWSDRLAIALACLAGIMALILFWIDKTPTAAAISLVAMAALMIYPVLHFVRAWIPRVVVLVLGFTLLGLFGWTIWPRRQVVKTLPITPLVTGQQPQAQTHTVAEIQQKGVETSARSGTAQAKAPAKSIPVVSAPQQAKQLPATRTTGTPVGNGTTVGNISQGPGSAFSIGQQGGITVGTLIEGAPPAPDAIVTWNVKSVDDSPPGSYRVFLSIKIKNDMPNAGFIAICDRACEPEGVPQAGVVGGTAGVVNDRPNVAFAKIDMPNPLRDGTQLQWEIKSKDGEPISILEIQKANIQVRQP
jgi:hypothetical protein